MKPPVCLASSVVLALCVHCGVVVSPAGGGGDSSREEASADVRDVLATDARDARSDVDAGDGGDSALEDASDAAVDSATPPDAAVWPGTNQSCGVGAAPTEHCREVWLPGGTITFFDRNAYELLSGFDAAVATPDCFDRPLVVQPGYIDAYEVSVARYRAWVRAGTPFPREGQPLFNGRLSYFAGTSPMTVPNWIPRRSRVGEECNYRDADGENDNLPVNCVNVVAAMSFCWWEGKHMATEAAWEFAARQGDRRAEYPFDRPVPPALFDPCEYGDVFRLDRCMRGRGFEAIDRFPLGQSVAPRGVFGLFGGVGEMVYAASDTTCGAGSPQLDGAGGPLRRGLSALDTGESARLWTPIGTRGPHPLPADLRVGFRCGRWAPEPRLTRVAGTR